MAAFSFVNRVQESFSEIKTSLTDGIAAMGRWITPCAVSNAVVGVYLVSTIELTMLLDIFPELECDAPALFPLLALFDAVSVSEALEGLTYIEFMQDRLDDSTTVEPSRCGWGMMLSLVTLGPIYSVVHTSAAIHPDGFLDIMTAPDPDILAGVAGAKWSEVPGICWNVVERLSWTMLGNQTRFGCQFRPVE